MKHAILLMSSLFILANTYSQNYEYAEFPKKIGVWRYSVTDDYWNHQYFDTETFRLDTLSTPALMKTFDGDRSYYEINKQIFVTNPGDSAPILAFDFNLTVGDTFIFKQGSGCIFSDTIGVVVSDDSTSFDTGRRLLILKSNLGSSIWAEGIGNITCINDVMCPFRSFSISGGRLFDCLFADSTSVPCNDITIGINEISSRKINFYPNPTNDELTINTSFNKLEVYDYSGRLLIKYSYNPKMTYDLSLLPIGTYLVVLKGVNEIHTGRIIKK